MGASVRSVLVVDDDEQVLAACKRSTTRELAIDACTDPDEARRLAADKDLVIVDLKLGEHSGLELVRELRGDRPELEIALISGFLSVDSIVAAVKAGASVVCSKPITPREVVRRVEGRASEPDPQIETPTLDRAERDHIERVITDCNGNISEAARRLGIFRSSLQRKLRRFST